MTRHELKEQLQHDVLRDNVDVAVGYVATHRSQTIRWVVIALVVVAIAGLSYGVYAYQLSQRQKALDSAMQIVDAPVVAQGDAFGKSYPTQQAKDTAAIGALTGVVAQYGGTDQGDTAQYLLAGIQVSKQKYADAERSFKTVADGNSAVAGLAKVGLAQLYMGTGKPNQAKPILQGLISNPSPLVSKEQATILMAQAINSEDPKRARQMLDSMKSPTARPAIGRAADQILQEAKKP